MSDDPALNALTSDVHNLDPSVDLLSQFSTPGFTPYKVKHPSGLVADHMGTHLSIYAPREPGGVATNLVARVAFPNLPKNPHSKDGWPTTMDAIDALDDTAKRLGRSGFVPDQ